MGLLLAGIAMVMTGQADDFLTLALWRGLTGIGSGAANVGIMGLWATWFITKKRGLASGVAVSGSSVALILTGLFVPWLLAVYGSISWRTCWILFGGITVLLGIVSWIFLRNHPNDLYLTSVGEKPGSTAAGCLPGAKLLWGDVYKSGAVWRLGLVYLAFGFSYIIYMTFFIKFLISDGGYTPAKAGGLFMTLGWFSLVCGLLWGGVSDRIGRKSTLAILFGIHTVAFGLFAIGSRFAFTCSTVLYGLSAWSIPAIMAVICGDMLGADLAPAGIGFVTLLFGLGHAFGPLVAGWIADSTGSFVPVFLLAAGVALTGGIGTMVLIRKSPGVNLSENSIIDPS